MGTNPLTHGSLMFRKKIFDTNKYNTQYRYAQDFDLLKRLTSMDCVIARLKIPLYIFEMELINNKCYEQYLCVLSIKKIIGDLSNEERVLVGLDVKPLD